MTDLILIGNGKRYELCKSNLNYLFWTPYQQITHHASAMCGLETGDLIGTGTISGKVRYNEELDEQVCADKQLILGYRC